MVGALCQFCTFVMNVIKDNNVVDATFCGLSKAYECVCHELVLGKLERLDVSDKANRLVTSCL